jgi:hypothetical protein
LGAGVAEVVATDFEAFFIVVWLGYAWGILSVKFAGFGTAFLHIWSSSFILTEIPNLPTSLIPNRPSSPGHALSIILRLNITICIFLLLSTGIRAAALHLILFTISPRCYTS